MEPKAVIALMILVAVVIIAVMVAFFRARRSRRLQERFGPEYDRTVHYRGNASRAEADLLNRERRVQSFSIKALTPAAREQFAEEWAATQRRFVDDPALAVTEADALVNRVMVARGYPMTDFEQRAADVSVAYPDVVQNYRSARAIAIRHARGEAGTEDLREAMVYYRSLLIELLDVPKSFAA